MKFNLVDGALALKFLNNYQVVRRSGSNPKSPSDTKILLIRAMIIDKGTWRTTKSKEIVCKNEWLRQDKWWQWNRERRMRWFFFGWTTNEQGEEQAFLYSYQQKPFFPRHTFHACRILLPPSVSRTSFCFTLPGHFRGRSFKAEGRVVPPASGWKYRRG